VNALGLVNVYAKDIGYLPAWLQRIWAGFNVGPDGGVSAELLASQVRATPASTLAPEAFLRSGLEALDAAAVRLLGQPIMRPHQALDDIYAKIHRFRAVDTDGLFALAKDLARVTADSIDVAFLNDYLKRAKEDRLGSLKATEKVLGGIIGPEDARALMGPLFGVYELRVGDAHLPPSDLDAAFDLVGIDQGAPGVHRGLQLIHATVDTVYEIVSAFEDGLGQEAGGAS
jgi:hypothetical protein